MTLADDPGGMDALTDDPDDLRPDDPDDPGDDPDSTDGLG